MMRHLLSLLAFAVGLSAQGTSLTGVMERLSAATTVLRKAIEVDHGPAPTDALRAIELALPALREASAGLPAPTVARAAIDELQAAVAALREPIGDGLASNPWDLSRLRGACSRCHATNRSDNPARGLFPNRGGIVTGTLRLIDRAGGDVDDRSGVVVFLEHPDDRPVPRPRPPAISQRGRRFDPPVLVVPRGTTVRFPNDDVVFHNVFSLSRGNAFDLGTYAKGKTRQRTFEHAGLVKVHCNIHAEMASHVLVLESERHCVTAADGSWCIPDVPPGDYRLRVWHALADEQRRDVTVADATVVDVPLQVQETKKRARHPDKHGRRYRKKY